MTSRLLEKISKFRERIREGKYRSEAAVREAIVVPVLRELDWDVDDPDAVIRELVLSGRRVDYGLCALGNKPSVFIEVKAIGSIIGADKQLFEYAFHEGVPIAVLTDGREWHFFLPGAQGTYEDRRVYKLDILEREDSESVRILERYLRFDRMRSGEALADAQRDYKNAATKKHAILSIPNAWKEIIEEPDELLIELIAERTETICGYRPDVEHIEKFLLDNFQRPVTPVKVVDANIAKPPGPGAYPGGKIEFELFGSSNSVGGATDALISILKALAERDSDFWNKLEPLARGRKRNHLARSKKDVYPLRPDLEHFTVQIAPGWWLGTNIANREKKRLLEAACKAAGITFGKDLRIDLPNTN